MTKSPWEKRVGMLLDPEFTKTQDFLYAYKPVDGLHGGQPKIDWFACDRVGRFWMIEVKNLPETRISINYMTEITPGQRDGLNAVAASSLGISLLAVGVGTKLHLFDWHEVQAWLLDEQHRRRLVSVNPTSLLLPFDVSFVTLPWNGPKLWKDLSLFNLINGLIAAQEGAVGVSLAGVPLPSAPIPSRPVEPSLAPEPYRPTSKRKGSTPILRLMPTLEP